MFERLSSETLPRRAAAARNPVLALAAVVALLTAGCASGHGHSTPPSPASSGAVAATSAQARAQDVALISAMYANINRAFSTNPDSGVRALLAAQYPGDRADVDFARCVSAIAPGTKSLPRATSLRFVPNVASATADPSYTVTSARVKDLHPQGRIYETEVTITLNARTSIHSRHQVIFDGKAYQFSAC